MTENSLKNRLGLFMVISHFLLILSVVLLRLIEYFDDSTLKVSLPIIVPLFASYSTTVIKNVMENRIRAPDNSCNINSASVFISFFIPALFVVVIYSIVIKQAVKPTSRETFAVLLGIGESSFGIYLGYIFKSLFPNYQKNDSTGKRK